MSKFYKEMYGLPDSFSKILTFPNGFILLTIVSIYTKLGDFVNLGVLF